MILTGGKKPINEAVLSPANKTLDTQLRKFGYAVNGVSLYSGKSASIGTYPLAGRDWPQIRANRTSTGVIYVIDVPGKGQLSIKDAKEHVRKIESAIKAAEFLQTYDTSGLEDF